MRRAAWGVLLLYVFAVPWEYSLELGPPLGNIARIIGIALLLATIHAVLKKGAIRRPSALHWATLSLYLWVCCSFFWTIDQAVTLERMRGTFQEMMVVWLAWELARDRSDLRVMVRAMVAGCWVLALLTVWNAVSPGAGAQIRFAAAGQDPNDVARYLDLGFPLAAYLIDDDRRIASRVMAWCYFLLGGAAVLLTASRGGFVAALVALVGSAIVLWRRYRGVVLGTAWALPLGALAVWAAMPPEIMRRISSIPQELRGGNLNQRLNIWSAGWDAFKEAPVLGHGAGSFVTASGLSPIDTAHNTALSILVEMGVAGLILALLVLIFATRAALQARASMRGALVTALCVWLVSSAVGTTAESRTTWMLFAMAAVAGRLSAENEQPAWCRRAIATMDNGRMAAGDAEAAH